MRLEKKKLLFTAMLLSFVFKLMACQASEIVFSSPQTEVTADIPIGTNTPNVQSNATALPEEISEQQPLATSNAFSSGTEERSIPSPRQFHAMAYDSNRKVVVMFGGRDKHNSYLNDMWEFDGQNWHYINTDVSPTPRGNSAMVFDPNNDLILLYGGGDENWTYDTWIYDATRDWRILSGIGAPHVFNPSLIYDLEQKRILLFGQATTGDYETWQFTEGFWQQLDVQIPFPQDIRGMLFADYSMIYDAERQRIILQTALDRTYELINENWQLVLSKDSGDGYLPGAFGPSVYDFRQGLSVFFGITSPNEPLEMEMWNYSNGIWGEVNLTNYPPVRTNHAMVYDESRGVVVLFGGYEMEKNLVLNDTWEYDGATWLQR